MSNLNTKYDWALSDDAKKAIDVLVANGFDRDLALACLEKMLPEEKIYTLQDEERDEPNERP